MPEKNRFPAVLQPIGATEVSDSLVARNNQTTGFHTDVVATPIAYRWQNNRDDLQQDDAVAAMRASTGSSGFHEMNHPVVVQPVPFTKSKRAQSVTDDETWVDGQVNPTLSLFDQGDTQPTTVAVAHAFYSTGGTHGVNQHPEVSPAIKVGSGLGIPSPPAVAFANRTRDGIKMPEIMADGVTPALTNPGGGGRSDAINVAVAHALRGEGFDASEDGTGRGTPLIPQAMTVRRLTPRECERLQGFPDDYTLIPWRKKQAEDCPDGPRYKALGNSMACNCMAWIGERIAAYEATP
jgi:site-specific DNA-cytosine methylase